MARTSSSLTVFCTIAVLLSTTSAIGVNYGGLADNLPPAATTLSLVKTTSINKLKLYDARADILNAFAGSGIDIIVGAGNDQITPLAQDPNAAVQWVAANVVPYTTTSIVGICLGNEVLSTAPALGGLLLPAMQNLHDALVAVGLGEKVKVSSPHSLSILAVSFPPSAGAVDAQHAEVITPMLQFFTETGAPFMINAYPYFAYTGNPVNISLDYALFQPSAPTVKDDSSNLVYTNLFDAQVDAMYAALGKLGYGTLPITVTETGWPTAGDATETAATIANAQLYNSGLIKHIQSGMGTPAKPNVVLETYIFALYNENMKAGPVSEQNWGLFLTTGAAVYDSGLNAVPGTVPTTPAAPGTDVSPSSAPVTGVSWCLAKPDADPVKLQNGLNFACSEGKADCVQISSGSPCFEPNTLVSHASFAYNSYYQINNRNAWDCYFDNTGMIVTVDPSTPGCKYQGAP
ncbi:hypothetical protein R1flu_023237 [Riccia fluitans]|uniref:glucan endo-1,3-beta-D-glucosidase n=1 Tax=Riccia fluitans TaxID=41844 RepID=A0ABD1XS01_9MARC